MTKPPTKTLWLATFDDGSGWEWIIFSSYHDDYQQAVKNFHLVYSQQFNRQFPVDYHFKLNQLTFVDNYKIVLQTK